MKRRGFILPLGGAIVIAPLSAQAQQRAKVLRIAFLSTTSPPGPPYVEAFIRGLRDLGYVEGRNITIEWRWGRGSTERLPEFAAEVVGLNVDVIVAANDVAGLAAQSATKTIPIVIATMVEPVGSGLVASIARPGGNITGLSQVSLDLLGKRLQLFKEALPNLAHVGIIIDVAEGPPSRQLEMNSAETTARLLNIRLAAVAEVRRPDEIAGAFAAVTQAGTVDGVLQLGGTMIFANRAELADQALKKRLPMICNRREEAEAGCLMSYGASFVDLFRRVAALVDKILKGARPAELPVEQPTKFEFVVNLKTARALGLTIPPAVLARADEVIE